MADRIYSIHEILEVHVSENVCPEIIREIEFQIGTFRYLGPKKGINPPRINIHAYADVESQGLLLKDGEAIFYDASGKVGAYYRNDKDRLLIGRNEGGFTIYADYSNFLINLYIQIILVQQGKTMVHAAAYQAGCGGITLVTGAGGIGKTAILGFAVEKMGLRYLGDDIVILGEDGECYSFPREFVLKSYHKGVYSKTFQDKKLPRWNTYHLKRFLIDNSPFMGVLKKFLKKSGAYYSIANLLRPQAFLASVPPAEIFGSNALLDRGKVSRIAYLDRVIGRDFSQNVIPQKMLVNRMFSVIHYEWKDFMPHLLSLGTLGVVDLTLYLNQSLAIFQSACISCKEHHWVEVPELAHPNELINFLSHENYF